MEQDLLLQASKDGRLDDIKRLLAAEPAAIALRAASGETPLMAALYRGHQDVVAVLVEAGAPFDIFAGAALGRIDVVEARLALSPAAANSYAYDGWTPLHLAAFFGHTATAERLLGAGANLAAVSRNSLRNTPLHAAVAGGHVDGSLLLIERGAPVNVADAGGHTPLHIAAEAGYVPIVKALLDRGADAHAVDADDRTPPARAAARNHTEVIDLINVRE
jgi:ankyrin repeat protein